jgi:hypothetical protein
LGKKATVSLIALDDSNVVTGLCSNIVFKEEGIMKIDGGDKSEDEFSVWEVCKESFGILLHKPIILLPMLIVIIFDQLLGILALFISFVLVYIIAYPIFTGMLTLMVKNILEKKKIEPNVAFKSALNKAPTLIAACFIVGFLFLAGILFFIIPGVIIGIWYFYIIPAIMLENLGVLDGMKASKSFAADKKFKTFLLLLLPLLFFTIFYYSRFDVIKVYDVSVFGPTMLKLTSHLIYLTWISVIAVYVYIKWSGLKTTNESTIIGR